MTEVVDDQQVPLPNPFGEAPVEQHRGQLRMAERFVHQHANTFRYPHGLDWMEWDGHRWASDGDGAACRAAVSTVKIALAQAAFIEDKREKQELIEDVRRSETRASLAGILGIAENLKPLAISAERDLDQHPELLNTPGGTVNLLTDQKHQHRQDDLLTKVTGGSITQESSSLWESFLERVLPDQEVREFTQRLFGYALFGTVTQHILPIFTGSGRNGKGTMRDALMAAFGDYAIEVDPALLISTKHDRHATFKMRLRGARLVFCSETEQDRKFAEAEMKRLTGGDPIEANLMRKDPITFDPSHTLVMMTNHLPDVSGDDPAVWARILVVPFDVVIPPEERDGTLPRRLKAEKDAVLSWALQGWRTFQEIGLCPPEAVRARTAAYRAESDTLSRFIQERCVVQQFAKVGGRDLYHAYASWCAQVGEQYPSEKEFLGQVEKHGYTKSKTGGVMKYRGLGLMSESTREG